MLPGKMGNNFKYKVKTNLLLGRSHYTLYIQYVLVHHPTLRRGGRSSISSRS